MALADFQDLWTNTLKPYIVGGFIAMLAGTHADAKNLVLADGTNISQNTFILATAAGANSGVATLGADGKVPASQLPSFVDEVIEAANFAALPAEGEGGKIYVTLDDNKTYRWSGTVMTEIGKMPAVATTIRVSGTADDNHVASEKAVRDALVAAGAYTLPAATASELGGVKVAAVATSGINNASGSISIATASASQLGGVKIGSNITVSNGVISVAESTNSQKGVVLTKSTVDGNNASLPATDSAVGTVPTVWAVETALKAKQDKLTAGTGVSITNGTVSVADTVIYEVVS